MRSIRTWLLVGAIACGLLGSAGSNAVRADFLSQFTGNTQMSDAPTSQGVVSFTVFETDNNPATSWVAELNARLTGTGGTALAATPIPSGIPALPLDLTARYVYMYQVVNFGTAPTSFNIENLGVRMSTPYTSVGNLVDAANPSNGVVFVDASGQVSNAGGNVGLGTDPSVDDVVNGNPSNLNQSITTISALSGSRLADSSNLAVGGNPPGYTQINWNLTGISTANQGTAFSTSTIVFMTSDFAPTYQDGYVKDGFPSDGDIATTVTPEPSSMVMAGIGLCGCFGAFYRRRRASSKLAAAAA